MKYSVMLLKLLAVYLISAVKRSGLKIPGRFRCCLRSIRGMFKEHNEGFYHVGKAFLEADISE